VLEKSMTSKGIESDHWPSMARMIQDRQALASHVRDFTCIEDYLTGFL